ncbi:MAG: endonuclease Q family protein [Candidatus Pacebacteria bacterium]|nr:endonuclease Q family protein [Candidatus Paceibacterota bacterium]
MKIIADFHIHSKYSRAVSRDMVLANISKTAAKKGIQVMGTGDFTHPAWFDEIKKELKPAEEGLFKIKNDETRFMLTAEIANIYSKGGKTRRVHNVIFSPTIEAVEKINNKLNWIGNLKSDGRPMLGLDSKKLLEIILDADPRCVLVPAHAWTPWFSIFGSMSGFDSIEECFDDLSGHIFAIETGLSSDPGMNWRLSALDKISLISNSDSHSPSKIGREANVFDCDLSYDGIFSVIKKTEPADRQAGKFLYTIEFFPEEGKYHFDGHSACKVSFSPEETKKLEGLCPVCGRKMTIGVLSRVNVLADRGEGAKPAGAVPYKNLIPLNEIIAEAKDVGVQTKTVGGIYEKLLDEFGTEMEILLETPVEKIFEIAGARVSEGLKNMREGKVKIKPGYDGEYGKISLFGEGDEKEKQTQKSLF